MARDYVKMVTIDNAVDRGINEINVFFGGLGFDAVRLNPVADAQERKRRNLASRDSRVLRGIKDEAEAGGSVHKARQPAVQEMKEEVAREPTSQEMGAVGAVARTRRSGDKQRRSRSTR